MATLIKPTGYKSILSVKETEHAIVAIKDFFQLALSSFNPIPRFTNKGAVTLVRFSSVDNAN